MHIFVSVCSYRDPLLGHTINDMMRQRSMNHDITYSIFDQSYHDESLASTHPELAFHPNVIYKRIDPEYTDGVVWARHINSLNVSEEHDMFYQIDSHMMFKDNWDEMVLSDYEAASKIAGHKKVIVTGSCHVFDYNIETKVATKIEEPNTTTRVRYYKLSPPHFIPGAHGDIVPATEYPERGFHILAGNFFTHAAWVNNVGLNPRLDYNAEEVMMSLTSWVAGYSIFHNTNSPSYHLNNTEEWPSKQWINPVIDMQRIYDLKDRGTRIFTDYIQNMDTDLKIKYYKHFGVDWINKKIDERARTYTHKNNTEYDCTPDLDEINKPKLI